MNSVAHFSTHSRPHSSSASPMHAAPQPVDLPGPLMVDVGGLELAAEDRRRIAHPLVGGIILFTRNYRDPEKLAALCAEIRALRPGILIGIDHEGGRVQRCREGFTRLPAMRQLGELWEVDAAEAIAAARDIGFVLAAELRACGVDLSFTPVLDLDWGRSAVVGNRAFHGDPQAVVALAGALIDGLQQAGMIACGKHFPGHGWAEADSHVAMPVDPRSLAELAPDLAPYRQLPLDAVMPAHVVYPQVDSRPAGFSPVWIKLLREELGFTGTIFSDDLSMHGASLAGDIVARADAAWSAGVDMLLVCNAPESVDELLARWQVVDEPQRIDRRAALRSAVPAASREALAGDARYQAGLAQAERLQRALA